jgi:hypothetical protein
MFALLLVIAVHLCVAQLSQNEIMYRYPRGSPEQRKAGTWLAGGFKGILVQLCGDLDYFAKWFGIPRWGNHSRMCSICRSTYKGPMSWLDNRAMAGWVSSVVTASNWRSHWNPDCILFLLEGLSSLSIALDYMHNSYLGWLQYFYGSVLFLLVYHIIPGEPLHILTHTIAPFIKLFQKENVVSQRYRPRLNKLTMFEKKKSFPRLRGRAADIRHATVLSILLLQLHHPLLLH